MKRYYIILLTAFGFVFGGVATAGATEIAPCDKATVTATWNGDNTVTASTSGETCTAQLSSWVITQGHPQKLLDRKIVEITTEPQTFSVAAPECGPYQIDLRTEKLPKGHYITGGISQGNSECQPPPPPEPSGTYKVNCHGFTVHLRDYPKGTIVEVAIDHTAAIATKLGKGGVFDYSINWDTKVDHFYELSVTYPKRIEHPKNWSVFGPVKACMTAKPEPPKQTHTTPPPPPVVHECTGACLPRTGGFASNYLAAGLLLPVLGLGLKRLGRKRA